MAHTDRQPTDPVFDDIKQAAEKTWNLMFMELNLHEDYYHEKVQHIQSLTNFADNWFSMIGRMDSLNQRLFLTFIRLKATAEFLREQRVHYGYVAPEERI